MLVVRSVAIKYFILIRCFLGALVGLVFPGQRAKQYLKSKTLDYFYARWVVLTLFLALFMVRIVCLQQFFIVAYCLGIVIISQCKLFWSPLNDTQTFSPKLKVGESADFDNKDSSTSAPRRRYPEFKVWFNTLWAVLFFFVGTLCPLFNVPVFAPILWSYLGGLGVVILVSTVMARRQASTEIEPKIGTVQIGLCPCGLHQYTGILHVKPWTALRRPLVNLHLDRDTWQDFLGDLEVCMNDNDGPDKPNVTIRHFLLMSMAKGIAMTLVSYYGFYILYSSPYVLPSCQSLHEKYMDSNGVESHSCNRFGWIYLLTHLPVCLYWFWVMLTGKRLQQHRVERCQLAVEEVCEAVRTLHPRLSMEITKHRWHGAPLLVQVHADMASTTPTLPNSRDDANDPFLVQVV